MKQALAKLTHINCSDCGLEIWHCDQCGKPIHEGEVIWCGVSKHHCNDCELNRDYRQKKMNERGEG